MSTSRISILLLAFTLTAAAARDARADGLFVMPHLSAEQLVELEAMYGQASDVTLISFDGAYRHPFGRRFSLALELGVVHARDDIDDGTSLSNFTVGGIYVLGRRGAGSSALVMSVSLPTASDGGSSGAAAATHAFFRIPDPGKYLPDTTTFRIAGDWQRQFGKVFFQLEAGTQILFRDGDDDILLRLGLGGGAWVAQRVALVAELTNMAYFLTDDEGEEDFLHTLDAGMHFKLQTGRLGARLYLPLDESTRNLDMLGLGVDLLLHL